MFEPFDSSRSRYASGGIVQTMPGELIDSLWLIIDLDLKGVIPLENLLTFHVKIMTAVLVFIFHKMIAVLGCVSICRLLTMSICLKPFMPMMMVSAKPFYCLVKQADFL